MEAQLSQLVNRLEAVTSRLESVSGNKVTDNAGSAAQDDGTVKPSVVAFDAIISGTFEQFYAASVKIGGDVKTQVELVKAALSAERDFLVKASKCKEPQQAAFQLLLKPVSDQMAAVQEFREKNRKSQLFNHLSAVSESIPALGWIAVKPTPAPFVKDMIEAGQFFSNRVLKDFKEKDQIHVQWVKSWTGTLNELQSYVKQFHTTGVEWNRQGCDISSDGSCPSGKCAAKSAGGPPPPGPPPPPMPADLLAAPIAPAAGGASAGETARSALFADLSKGEGVTKGLKKVTDDMKVYKNPALRTGPQPFKPSIGPKPGAQPPKAAAAASKPASKPPKCELEGKKWAVEYQNGNKNIVISETEMKQTVYIFKCDNSTIQVKGKVNAITMDSCKKSALVFDEAISSVDFVNCQSVQVQVIGKVPTFSIDKTDGCMIYLSKDSLSTQIVTAKSSEMNILVPDETGDFKEFAIPEQFRSHWNGSRIATEITEMNFCG